MPDGGEQTRVGTSGAVRAVRRWLHDACRGAIRTLPALDLERYSIAAAHGWELSLQLGERSRRIVLLLPAGFPYAAPRTALSSGTRVPGCPHIEDNGLICLPPRPATPRDPISAVQHAVEDACGLLEDFESNADAEFRREFISYWNRTVRSNETPIYSLLQVPFDAATIFLWQGTRSDIVASSRDDILRHLGHLRIGVPQGGFATSSALAVPLQRAPTPEEIPTVSAAFADWLRSEAPVALGELERLSQRQASVTCVFSALSETGYGLIAVSLKSVENPKVNGFRPGHAPADSRFKAWLAQAKLARRTVKRFDAAWIHGRGLDPAQAVLAGKSVSVIGCGAMGSPIAVRLAQAGVGTMVLVDAQVLESANIGRHVLGAEYVGLPKAVGLARELGKRFPHMQKVDAISKAWDGLSNAEREAIAASDLIVCATGEWSAEGPINEWHQALRGCPPIVYAWLEEHGAAGHAYAVVGNQNGCLWCILDDEGGQRSPETIWPNVETTLLPEPACGASFQPFGPAEVGFAEAMTSELCLELLLGKVAQTTHRVYATSTARLASLRGEWSAAHQAIRGVGQDGSMMFTRPTAKYEACPLCNFAA